MSICHLFPFDCLLPFRSATVPIIDAPIYFPLGSDCASPSINSQGALSSRFLASRRDKIELPSIYRLLQDSAGPGLHPSKDNKFSDGSEPDYVRSCMISR